MGEGLEGLKEGGGICVLSAQAPRGPEGEGCPRCAACCCYRRLFIVCRGSAQFSWREFRELLVPEPVYDWYPDHQHAAV